MPQHHPTSGGKKVYFEILGDTILPKSLIIAIIFNILVSLGAYNLGLRFFSTVASENMVTSYSLLVGILGGLFSLFICSLVFKPNRKLVEEQSSVNGMREAFHDLNLNPHEELQYIENDPITKKELEELGIYEQFKALERESRK
ncbi:hypothetical protein [Sporosarcina sp. HYO08]|uniref:hypothetical protein n=1 Tax=Sporosarcina sp. HYO08 TaxID=1759557 RepID=UPI00079A38B9|nr:hypothetical protein [Sporosarcina sp. HYO08]KXH87052.1 hypothetical protein AU377_00275 [Sporosarcina sp. HYO08]